MRYCTINNATKRLAFVCSAAWCRRLGLLVALCWCVCVAAGQETVVVGQVLDKHDRKPLEAVSVYFRGTNIRTETNGEGYFVLRNADTASNSVVVFSLMGYTTQEIRVWPGGSVGVEVLLEEKVHLLDELFVVPGVNPADDLMKNVRRHRKRNNTVPMGTKGREQTVVLLNTTGSRRENSRMLNRLSADTLPPSDSSLLPLYMEESEYDMAAAGGKETINRNTFNTPEVVQTIVAGALNGLSSNLNFYNNSVSVMGKAMVSPLANVGGAFYRYYLIDSVRTGAGKEYLIRFRSKNPKNLAFDGEMRIDSASFALIAISAQLPPQANINFVHHLRLQQQFSPWGDFWIPRQERSAWAMTYDLLKEADLHSSELLITRRNDYRPGKTSVIAPTDSFANSPYSREQLQEQMDALRQMPLFRTAAYMADLLLTGYARAGRFDIGPVIDIARLTRTEGLRVGLPLRTNERLWTNVMLGGYIAYGTRDKTAKYGVETQWKWPMEHTHVVVGVRYADDNRRVDYDYSSFHRRENPLTNGDENLISTLLSFKSQHRISRRKEFSAFLFNDWSPDIESKWIYRDVTYFPNELMPLTRQGVAYASLRDRHVSFTTRFSFGERTLDGHFRRLYVRSDKPVIYATLEGGHYRTAELRGNYGRITGAVLQRGRFMLGEWRYMLEGGKIVGHVPYPMLKFVQGKDGDSYNRLEFALMNDREYVADTYATLFTELITNGMVFNRIPIIKHLNLREIASFKMAYGTLSDAHATKMDFPAATAPFTQPYSEIGVGFCNLLGVFSAQSIWRLSDRNKPNINRWGVKFNIILML